MSCNFQMNAWRLVYLSRESTTSSTRVTYLHESLRHVRPAMQGPYMNMHQQAICLVDSFFQVGFMTRRQLHSSTDRLTVKLFCKLCANVHSFLVFNGAVFVDGIIV